MRNNEDSGESAGRDIGYRAGKFDPGPQDDSISHIKSDGFAVDNHEFHTDVWCTAAPVRDSHGQVIAAIGITSPAAQSDRQKKTDTCTYVKKVAEKFSAVLGFDVT